MTTIRCSSLPLLSKCPAAVLEDGLRVDPDNAAAGAGTAAHAALETLPSMGRADWDRVDDLAKQHGCDAAEVRALVGMGQKLWGKVAHLFDAAQPEVSLVAAPGNVTLTGHPDLLRIDGDRALVLDHKTGRLDPDYRDQMLGYAALVMLNHPDVDEVACLILWIRDGDAEWHRMRRDELDAWCDRLVATVNGRMVHKPGTHCVWCPRRPECPAVGAMERTSVSALTEQDGHDLALYTPDEIVALYDRAKYVSRLAGEAVDAIRAHVDACGPVEGTDAVLTLQDEQRRALDPMLTWSVLEGIGFVDEDFADVMKLSVSAIEKRVRAKAAPRQGAADVRALRERLEAAGAVSTKTTSKLRRKRA